MAAGVTQLALVLPVPHSTDSAFRAWVAANPVLVEWLESRALELRRSGRDRYSIKKLFEEARWNTDLRERLGEFKLNNNWHSRAARLLMERRRELVGFFETRRLAPLNDK